MLDLYFIHTSSILQLYLKEGEKQEERRKKKEERRKKKEERRKKKEERRKRKVFTVIFLCDCLFVRGFAGVG